MIKIITYYSEWVERTEQQAQDFYNNFMSNGYSNLTAKQKEERRKQFNEKHIRGAYINEKGQLIKL